MVKRVVITSANRGIGLEFARQYLTDGWQVVATTRSLDNAQALRALGDKNQNNLHIYPLDITKAESIAAFAELFTTVPIDVLINNAGGLGRIPTDEDLSAMTFGHLDYGLWIDLFLLNAVGAVRLTESLIDSVGASDEKKVVFISSTAGSILEGGHPSLAYGTSKAALNKATTLMAADLKKQGISVLCLCPGRVKTRMGIGADVEPEDSVSGMRNRIDELSVSRTGRFIRFNGETIQW